MNILDRVLKNREITHDLGVSGLHAIGIGKNTTPPPQSRGVGSVVQRPNIQQPVNPQNNNLPIYIQNRPMQGLQTPRGFDYRLPNFPQINPNGVETYSTSLNPRLVPNHLDHIYRPMQQTNLPMLPMIGRKY